ncbi:D-hexose-6-phosphate mutarotase [Portibacter lacus]|uniref:glucose-6-phosphate 1-epimerase n=1 Tax=Portibacter lacus TaxID=1099794 RepID=A0AA37SQL9_9BACT|nr:D-hexose-6-phosphate mutarotase [Portibacter lacus]GLR18878.1 D-hexose-6-phosphate mutarotase [Portibacter lacus]
MISFAKHTAHLISWIPEGHDEVMYLSTQAFMEAGKPIRGGVPICWPWFGSLENKPAHGFARINSWNTISENSFSLPEQLIQDEWGNKASLVFTVTEDGNKLKMELTTTNLDSSEFEFTQALHTYFKVSDINKVSIKGHDKQAYYDKVLDDNDIQKGTLIFNGETDRIYTTTASSLLIDPGLQREILITKKGSNSTVIWNPGPEKSVEMKDMPDDGYLTMCCVEAANTHLDPVTLQPGASHTIVQEITVSKF